MKINRTSTNSGLRKSHESHSVEDILAAGGATAFGRQSGKNNESIIHALQKTTSEPFTSEEWNELLNELDATK